MVQPDILKFQPLQQLNIQKYERYLPTAFDDTLSMLQKTNMMINYLHEIGKLNNDVVEQWNAVVEWTMNEGLSTSVDDKVNGLVNDGTMDGIINEKLFTPLNTKLAEAYALASDPLSALTNSGYKITTEDLSQTVLDAMTGTTGLTLSKGLLETNRGVTYPLKNVVRDSQLRTITDEVKNVILDVKIVNANPNKYYSIAYVSKGYRDSYGVTVYEYDKETFSLDSNASRQTVILYHDPFFVGKVVSGIDTKIFTRNGVTFIITVDHDAIVSSTSGLNIAELDTGRAYGAVVDESCYIISSNTSGTNKNSSSFPLAVKNDNGVYIVKFNYSTTQNMVIEFDKLGINKILHFKRFYLQDKTTNILDDDFYNNRTLLYEASSDWLSPYRIEAINNGNGNARFTTGGNHGTDGGTGFATARFIESKAFVDGLELKSGEVAYCNNLQIETTHHVSAYNAIDLTTGTKRDSLKEVVTYNISPENLNVSVFIQALEPLIMTDYSGLQAQEGAWADKLYYMEDNQPIVFDISGEAIGQSGTKELSSADRWVMKKDGNIAVAYYNTDIGLGTRENVSLSNSLFWHTGTKIYGRLLYNGSTNGVQLNKNDNLYWNGGYTFTQGLECSGAENAYVIYEDNKKIYVVDFFNSANTYLKPHKNDVNKRIEIIQKSDTITCENYITSNGLKINASGYGQLKFTVN